MELLTQKLREKFPPIYSGENKNPEEVEVVAKFFTPFSNWTWYATEFDGVDLFFGYVQGLENELGYFSLCELESIEGPAGLKIERDLYFSGTLADVMTKI